MQTWSAWNLVGMWKNKKYAFVSVHCRKVLIQIKVTNSTSTDFQRKNWNGWIKTSMYKYCFLIGTLTDKSSAYFNDITRRFDQYCLENESSHFTDCDNKTLSIHSTPTQNILLSTNHLRVCGGQTGRHGSRSKIKKYWER